MKKVCEKEKMLVSNIFSFSDMFSKCSFLVVKSRNYLEKGYDRLLKQDKNNRKRLYLRIFSVSKEWFTYKFAINISDEVFCERTVDRFGGCWPDTKPGTIAKINCPAIPGFNPKGNVDKFFVLSNIFLPLTNSSEKGQQKLIIFWHNS